MCFHTNERFFLHLLLSTWNYFEAGHGKGNPDGAGATVKRTADRLVNEGKDIDCLDTISKALKDNLRKIDIHAIKTGDFANMKKN